MSEAKNDAVRDLESAVVAALNAGLLVSAIKNIVVATVAEYEGRPA